MKAILCGLLLLVGSGFIPAHAVIQIECTDYSVTYPDEDGNPIIGTGTYCWAVWVPDPPAPNPPDFPWLPGGPDGSNTPNPNMCQQTLDNWPADCSTTDAPTVEVNGCTGIPGNIGPVNITGACNNHDQCYTTYGMSKSSCDQQFLQDMTGSCHQLYDRLIMWVSPPQTEMQAIERLGLIVQLNLCTTLADGYTNGVAVVPESWYYEPAQEVGQCIKAHEDRDQYCGE